MFSASVLLAAALAVSVVRGTFESLKVNDPRIDYDSSSGWRSREASSFPTCAYDAISPTGTQNFTIKFRGVRISLRRTTYYNAARYTFLTSIDEDFFVSTARNEDGFNCDGPFWVSPDLKMGNHSLRVSIIPDEGFFFTGIGIEDDKPSLPPPTASSTSSTGPKTSDSASGGSSKSSSQGAVIGGAVGGSIAGIAILLLCLLWYRKQRRIRTENMIDPVDLENSDDKADHDSHGNVEPFNISRRNLASRPRGLKTLQDAIQATESSVNIPNIASTVSLVPTTAAHGQTGYTASTAPSDHIRPGTPRRQTSRPVVERSLSADSSLRPDGRETFSLSGDIQEDKTDRSDILSHARSTSAGSTALSHMGSPSPLTTPSSEPHTPSPFIPSLQQITSTEALLQSDAIRSISPEQVALIRRLVGMGASVVELAGVLDEMTTRTHRDTANATPSREVEATAQIMPPPPSYEGHVRNTRQ